MCTPLQRFQYDTYGQKGCTGSALRLPQTNSSAPGDMAAAAAAGT